jgi:transposase-like protein
MPGKRYSLSFKQALVLEVLSGHRRSEVARKYDLSVETLKDWLEQFRAGRLGGDATGAATTELSRLRLENYELRQLASQQALEITFLKKLQPPAPSPPDDDSSPKSGAR